MYYIIIFDILSNIFIIKQTYKPIQFMYARVLYDVCTYECLYILDVYRYVVGAGVFVLITRGTKFVYAFFR